MGSEWSLLFLDGLWMVAEISSWVLDGYCYFLVSCGCLVSFPCGLWMVTVVMLPVTSKNLAQHTIEQQYCVSLQSC